MLHMKDLTKVYRTHMIETHALRGFDIDVKQGEFVTVTGPSGSGKTTFLNIAGLLEDFDGGEFTLDGVDVKGLSDDKRSRLRNEKLGFIFQGFNLIPDLNLFDNVDVPLRYRGFSAAERRGRIEGALAEVGLASRMRHYPGGALRRPAAARRDRASPRRLAAAPPRRRAHGQPRQPDGAQRHGAPRADQREGDDHHHGHARSGARDARAAQRAHHRRPGERPAARSLAGARIGARLRARPCSATTSSSGCRSLRRNPALTALMIFTLAIGVAASIATLTILHVMSGNPIPHKSDRLIVPLLDVGQLKGYVPGERNPYANQSSYRDVTNYLRSGQGARRTALYEISGSAEPARREDPVVMLQGIATTSDFFAMFEVPFAAGQAWTPADDARESRVAVLSRAKASEIFGEKVDAVGKRFRMWGSDFTVVGVIDGWNPVPRYTNLVNGSGGFFRGENQVYVPFTVAIAHEQHSNGSTTCDKDSGVGWKGFLESECIWMTAWFELASASDRPALQSWLDAYAAEQRRGGRLERNAPNRPLQRDGVDGIPGGGAQRQQARRLAVVRASS
jgi:ABC-type lipoprotein export system ATPase subunit